MTTPETVRPEPSPPPVPPEAPPPVPPGLRFLQVLVTVLMLVMIFGIIGILGLIWHRYSKAQAPLPEVITLPDGARASAYTQGSDWYAVVTEEDVILIFDRATGRLRKSIDVAAPE